MLRLPVTVPIYRALGGQLAICLRGAATKAPEKIEVFVDDKPVLVDPGTTVLQVNFFHTYTKNFPIIASNFRLQPWWASKFHGSAIMNVCPSPETVGCAWLKLKSLPK